MKKFKTLSKLDRPREKLIEKGPKNLSNIELISVIIGSGTKGSDVLKVSNDILKLLENGFEEISLEKLKNITGVGLAKASKILASIELARRFLLRQGTTIKTPQDIVNLMSYLRNKKQEYFIVITLDGANNLIREKVIFIGTLNQSLVHPREIFATALEDRAAKIILVHNHPSNCLDPSIEDKEITRRLIKAGNLLGVKVLDHIIVGNDSYLSFKNEGILF